MLIIACDAWRHDKASPELMTSGGVAYYRKTDIITGLHIESFAFMGMDTKNIIRPRICIQYRILFDATM